jgi:hypothetical protein
MARPLLYALGEEVKTMRTHLTSLLSLFALTLPLGASAAGHSTDMGAAHRRLAAGTHTTLNHELPAVTRTAHRTVTPYAGMDFDFRLEFASAERDQPTASVAVLRMLEDVEGSWGALSIDDDNVNISWSDVAFWPAVFDGDLYDGQMEGLSIMLAEDAIALENGWTFPVTIPSAYRDFDLDISYDPSYPYPVVATVFMSSTVIEGDLLILDVDHIEYREVDADGRPWPLGTLD